MIHKTTADKIAVQAKTEIATARTYKNGKVSNWQLNEEMYYGKKIAKSDSRANVALGQMQEFVHTLLSKIDNSLTFKFTKRKPSQLQRTKYLNALKEYDQDRDFWDLKDIAGKKQGIIYGRAVYFYSASSHAGYQSSLEPIDVYDFLIDPSANGLDIETAMNLGRWGVVRTMSELKEGAKSGIYHAKQVKDILEEGGNTVEDNIEETNKKSRSYGIDTVGDKETKNPNKYKFWEWMTTYEGERYYVLMDNSGRWIRCEKLVDIFATDMYPVWTWACFPDLTEFWTPSYCDYIREILMAQEISINQMLDNAEAINNPQKVVDVAAIADMSKVIKYRKNGIIPVKAGVDMNKAIQFIKVPSISTPLEVFNSLSGIKDRASGVTAGGAGVADEDGKVGIYEGNQEATADRFGLLNKSYAFGYKRFAKLYEAGVREHLLKSVAVEILGPNGVEVKNVSKKDLFKKGDEYGTIVEASDAELTNSLKNQTVKLNFLLKQAQNTMINQQKLLEMSAKISGLSEDEVRELLDVNSFGNEELMAEADRDIEILLSGDKIEINQNANNAYRQKILSYMKEHGEDINDKQFAKISEYFTALEPVVMRNEARNMQNELTEELKNNAGNVELDGSQGKGNVPKLDSPVNLPPEEEL